MSQESLRSLTRGAQQLIHRDLPWEPLEVAPPVALEAFSHSRYFISILSCSIVSFLGDRIYKTNQNNAKVLNLAINTPFQRTEKVLQLVKCCYNRL